MSGQFNATRKLFKSWLCLPQTLLNLLLMNDGRGGGGRGKTGMEKAGRGNVDEIGGRETPLGSVQLSVIISQAGFTSVRCASSSLIVLLQPPRISDLHCQLSRQGVRQQGSAQRDSLEGGTTGVWGG